MYVFIYGEVDDVFGVLDGVFISSRGGRGGRGGCGFSCGDSCGSLFNVNVKNEFCGVEEVCKER